MRLLLSSVITGSLLLAPLAFAEQNPGHLRGRDVHEQTGGARVALLVPEVADEDIHSAVDIEVRQLQAPAGARIVCPGPR